MEQIFEKESPSIYVKGHVLIKDAETGEILLDKSNAIHPENFSSAIATALSNRLVVATDTTTETVLGQMKYMAFGRGGTTVSAGTGKITYLTPNIIGQDSTLYQETFRKLVDDNDQRMNPIDAPTNNIRVSHVPGNLFSDIIVTCTLDPTEPFGQSDLDNSALTDDTYVFDEIGIIDSNGSLLTHIIFHPIQKSLNRILQVVYNIRIQIQ